MNYKEPLNSALFPSRNGSYSAGNPAQGIAGSIVPPEAIEHPMREMENVLKAAGVTPSNSDLTQLAQSMRIFAICTFWPESAAADLTHVSGTQFSTTTEGAFAVNDRLLINGELLAIVTAVGSASPYVVTVEYATVPATINKIQSQRLYDPSAGSGYAPASHVGATGAAHGVATASVAGFMSAEDKAKLDELSSSGFTIKYW